MANLRTYNCGARLTVNDCASFAFAEYRRALRVFQEIAGSLFGKPRALDSVETSIAKRAQQGSDAAGVMVMVYVRVFHRFFADGAATTLGNQHPIEISHGHTVEAPKCRFTPKTPMAVQQAFLFCLCLACFAAVVYALKSRGKAMKALRAFGLTAHHALLHGRSDASLQSVPCFAGHSKLPNASLALAFDAEHVAFVCKKSTNRLRRMADRTSFSHVVDFTINTQCLA